MLCIPAAVKFFIQHSLRERDVQESHRLIFPPAECLFQQGSEERLWETGKSLATSPRRVEFPRVYSSQQFDLFTFSVLRSVCYQEGVSDGNRYIVSNLGLLYNSITDPNLIFLEHFFSFFPEDLLIDFRGSWGERERH